MDTGCLDRIAVAHQSGQRRVLTVHDSRNERTAALRRAALCGAAPPRHAEEVTVELAVRADGRLAPTSRRVGDPIPDVDIKMTLRRVDRLEWIRNTKVMR